MRSGLLLSIALCISTPLLAQQDPTPIHSSTTVPANSRYEIVQSTLAARWLFKLDRQTGVVYQIVRTKDDDNVWEQMEVRGLPLAPAVGVHYELFLSGLAAKFMFLMNLDTGQTWQLQSSTDAATKEEDFVWNPI
jgi:hypothetical protein